MSYSRNLKNALIQEREAYGEPLYTMLWCILVGMENIEDRISSPCEECRKRVEEG